MKLSNIIKETYHGKIITAVSTALLTEADFLKVFEVGTDAVSLQLVQQYADDHDMNVNEIIKMIIKEEGYVKYNAFMYLPTKGQAPLRYIGGKNALKQFKLAPLSLVGPKNYRDTLSISMGGESRKYLAKEIYELAHGKLPKGFGVVHKDGNKNNYRLDNLTSKNKSEISRETMIRTHTTGKIGITKSHSRITKNIIIAELYKEREELKAQLAKLKGE